MHVLALDTTTRGGSVALVEDDRLVAEAAGDPTRSHAERLPLDVVRLLDVAGIPMNAVDLFAVASGPGSFTGVRIGIATTQGLAFATGRRIAAISTLEALAHAASVDLWPGALVAASIDAQRREVFGALYRVVDAKRFTRERLVEVDAPRVGAASETLERWRSMFGVPAVIVGDGAAACAADAGVIVVGQVSLAGVIGRLAVDRGRRGQTVKPAGVQPLYVRRPDAELARQRQDGR